MQTVIHQRVALANAGKNPYAIIKLKSGWVVAGDTQQLEGYCLLLSDPVVYDLNSLDEAGRIQYSLDGLRIGDALLAIKKAYRINYETWGNLDQALHTHIVPRYKEEPDDKRTSPACMVYDKRLARPFDREKDADFVQQMKTFLTPFQAN